MARKKRQSSRRRPIKRTTRKRAKRRKVSTTPKRISKKVVATGGANAHFNVMRRPFSTATAQPKIPDGKVATSLSRRLQKVTQIQNAVGESDIDIVMVPSLGVMGTVFDTTYNTGGRNHRPIGFSGQTVGMNGLQLENPTGENNIINNTGVSHWRVVSQALHLTLNQTEEENDGWFEACRFNFSTNAIQWGFRNLDDNVLDLSSIGLFPDNQFQNQVLNPLAGNMVEQPGYQTGLLKDIGKLEFKLNPKGNATEFQNLNSEYRMKDASDTLLGIWDAAQGTFGFSKNNSETVPITRDLIDQNYDAIFIRLHCRTNNGTTSNGSKLILNAIQNIEFCFSPDSDLATFQTPNVAHKKAAEVQDAMNNNHGASQMHTS